MKKLVSMILVLVCLVSCAVCCAEEKEVIKFGYDPGQFDGKVFTDSWTYKAEIRLSLEVLGWEAEYVPVEFGDIEESLNDGTIDCYWMAYTMQGREDLYAWSEPYLMAGPIFIYKVENRFFGDVEANVHINRVKEYPTGLTIGMLEGSETYDRLIDAEKAIVDQVGTIKTFPTFMACKEALDNGVVDLVFDEFDCSAPLFADFNQYNTVYFTPNENNAYGVAFKKGNEDKAAKVTEALKTIWNNGSWISLQEEMNAELGYSAEVIKAKTQYNEYIWLLK